MKRYAARSFIGTSRLDEDVISPKEFLELSPEQRRDIIKAVPYVKGLGTVDIDNQGFVAIRIKRKQPKYTVIL